jgi:heterogeneous nuclear ribonucleoprotein U-like protein 1
MKPICYMLIGVPGSGKSTYSNQIIKEMSSSIHLEVVSSDEYIEKYAQDHGKTYQEVYRQVGDEATKYANRKIQSLIKQHASFIWDQTNVFASARLKKMRNLLSNKYDVIAVTIELSEEELARRIETRKEQTGKHIPWAVVKDMLKNYSRPGYEEGFVEIYVINDKSEILLLPMPEPKNKP